MVLIFVIIVSISLYETYANSSLFFTSFHSLSCLVVKGDYEQQDLQNNLGCFPACTLSTNILYTQKLTIWVDPVVFVVVQHCLKKELHVFILLKQHFTG